MNCPYHTYFFVFPIFFILYYQTGDKTVSSPTKRQKRQHESQPVQQQLQEEEENDSDFEEGFDVLSHRDYDEVQSIDIADTEGEEEEEEEEEELSSSNNMMMVSPQVSSNDATMASFDDIFSIFSVKL